MELAQGAAVRRSLDVGLGRQRLFAAIKLSEEMINELSSVRSECEAAGLRPIAADQAHLTLVFLPQIPGELIPGLIESLKKPTTNAFPLRLKIVGLGRFCSERGTAVVYAGIKDPEGDLQELQENVLLACRSLGVSPEEERPFRPHITLARARRSVPPNEREIAAMSSRWRKFLFGVWNPNEMALFRSEQTERGRVHTVIRKYP